MVQLRALAGEEVATDECAAETSEVDALLVVVVAAESASAGVEVAATLPAVLLAIERSVVDATDCAAIPVAIPPTATTEMIARDWIATLYRRGMLICPQCSTD